MKMILLTVLMGFNLVGCLNPGSSDNSDAQPVSDNMISHEERDSLDSYIEKSYPDSLPGAEVLMMSRERVLYHSISGVCCYEKQNPLKRDMIFETGSITKLFTAVGILNLIEEGKLTLNDPLSKYFPDHPNSDEIRIKHLLSHTSGIPDYAIHFLEKNLAEHFESGFSKKHFFQEANRDHILEYLKNNHREISPGSEWEYSNGGYYYLGMIIEQVSGMSYFTYIKKKVIDPLDLEFTTFEDPVSRSPRLYSGGHFYLEDPSKESARHYQVDYLPNDYAFSVGSLNSRLKDLYRFYKGVTQGQILEKQTVRKAWTPFRLKNGERASTGYGWFVHKKHGKTVICHPGCTVGFSAITQYVPEDDLFIGLYTNRSSQQFNVSDININLVNKAFKFFYE